MKSYLLLIIGCSLVTYIPRLLPLVFLSNMELSYKRKRFLQFIPYTSLTILIIRGIITAESSMMVATFVGIGLAGIVAYFKSNLVLSVAAAILASFAIANLM
ncbi:AzlD domain-containing protein [Tissierella creatinini]|nr:AzlD domain-containing protein [Tissierella creatinini]TJX64638.1 AzlD domain-containing protein [Soehngenia saccharolytica]